jgi:hypothetical protein
VAHPHIGTFKLVKVVENLRAQIIALGGEIRFEQRVTDVLIEETGARRACARPAGAGPGHGQPPSCAPTMWCWRWATARATPLPCCTSAACMEAKPFSIGFRIEHPQGVIDRARWGRHAGHPLLGAADYKLVHHASQRPHGLQLLHVPRRHRGGRHQRARAAW